MAVPWERRLVVRPGDVDAGHVGTAAGERKGGGMSDAPGASGPGDQCHTPRERALRECLWETHRANVRRKRAAAPSGWFVMRGVWLR